MGLSSTQNLHNQARCHHELACAFRERREGSASLASLNRSFSNAAFHSLRPLLNYSRLTRRSPNALHPRKLPPPLQDRPKALPRPRRATTNPRLSFPPLAARYLLRPQIP